MILTKILQKMFKQDLKLQVMNEHAIPLNARYRKEKIIGLMKDELGGKISTKFFGLKEKTYTYLIDDGNEDGKARDTKKCVIKRKLQFENHKNFSEATHLENKIKYLEENEIDIDKGNHK